MGMELVKCGSLQQYIKANGKQTDIEASKIMNSVLSALSYIHDKNVIHRDLKLANILIHDSTNLKSVKIIDFGFGH
jgi:serine/threonine protein kinase